MSSREFADHVVDLLRPLGPVGARRMFGGFGLFLDGLMFALIIDDTLHLKADPTNRAAFLARGMEPFCYLRRGRPVNLAYHVVPADVLDQRDELLVLARSGFAAALRAHRGASA